MNVDIRLAGGKTLYFPYLDNKRGQLTPIRNELALLMLYALFVDRIVLPPSSVFDGPYALQNLADLNAVPNLRVLSEAGVLVTSSAKPEIRDFADLFESYSGLTRPSQSPATGLAVFGRDEVYQRSVYSQHLPAQLRLQGVKDITLLSDVAAALRSQPTHFEFTSSIAYLAESFEQASVLRNAAAIAYFFAGARGNSALTPPVTTESRHEHFDYFYSREAVICFGRELERRIRRPMLTVSPKQLLELRQRLLVFSEQYLQISRQHRGLFEQILAVSRQRAPVLRMRGPIVALQASVATAIAVALAPIFGLLAVGVAIAAKFGWETISKSTRLNDRVAEGLRQRVVRMGLVKPYEKDLLEALETFRKAVAAVAP